VRRLSAKRREAVVLSAEHAKEVFAAPLCSGEKERKPPEEAACVGFDGSLDWALRSSPQDLRV